MLKEISLTLFHNQELISLLLIEGVILIVSFMIYKSLKKKDEIIKPHSKETSADRLQSPWLNRLPADFLSHGEARHNE